jgi:glycosyltransferase involved in cell wall biosynthesis
LTQPEVSSSRLAVLVPVYNEVHTVEHLLRTVRATLPDAQLIVVDDGSRDGSLDIIEALSSELGLDVLAVLQNQGKGSAVRLALTVVNRDLVVIQDADLEYDPHDLKKLLAVALTAGDSVVYGSRYLVRAPDCEAKWLNVTAVRLLAIWAGLLYGSRLSDPHTCYKLLPTPLMRKLNLQSHGFELCAEINSKLLKGGVPICEIPVSYRARSIADGKKIRWYDFFRAVWVYFRLRFGN